MMNSPGASVPLSDLDLEAVAGGKGRRGGGGPGQEQTPPMSSRPFYIDRQRPSAGPYMLPQRPMLPPPRPMPPAP